MAAATLLPEEAEAEAAPSSRPADAETADMIAAVVEAAEATVAAAVTGAEATAEIAEVAEATGAAAAAAVIEAVEVVAAVEEVGLRRFTSASYLPPLCLRNFVR